MKNNTQIKVGRTISIIFWIVAWLILSFKLDFVTLLGMLFFALGLSGIIIWYLLPVAIKLYSEKNESNNKIR